MFNLGPIEMMLIVAAGLIFLGPKELPKIARKIGQSMREIRNAATDFSREIQNPLAGDPNLDSRDLSDLGDPTAPIAEDEFADNRIAHSNDDDDDEDDEDHYSHYGNEDNPYSHVEDDDDEGDHDNADAHNVDTSEDETDSASNDTNEQGETIATDSTLASPEVELPAKDPTTVEPSLAAEAQDAIEDAELKS